MAPKRSNRKVAVRKPLKSSSASKKKTVPKKGKATTISKSSSSKKKSKTISGTKKTGAAKKTPKVTKATAKKKTPTKATSETKKVMAKKSPSKKSQGTSKKKVGLSVSKLTKATTGKKVPSVRKKKTSIAGKKDQSQQVKKTLSNRPRSPVAPSPSKGQSMGPQLSSIERYNLGGLFACAIDRVLDPDFSRLRAVLRHLDLSSQEKDNLIRLSEGLMIPKLFAEGLDPSKVEGVLLDLVNFARTEGNYENNWREDIRQVGLLLGWFPEQVQEIEQRGK